ncbi:hypothetical protein SAY86_014206 [Trapa natans]|uniref:RING-type E3 ubiquitin transferase n=1 Tax=Trapa natans TaxID=22666 RepID=A0AAN7L060_TRANT|nr:hypothetical protein SAY86_014206 [Trapa natans]
MEFREAVTKMGRPADRHGEFYRLLSKFYQISSKASSPTSSRSSSPRHKRHVSQQIDFPSEFVCPVSRSLMADPVIVFSGHSFDRVSVEVCKSAGYTPTLEDGLSPDFSAVIPNLALKSAILTHCKDLSLPPPEPISFSSMEKKVHRLISARKEDRNSMIRTTAFSKDSAGGCCSSSDESVGTSSTTTTSNTATAAANDEPSRQSKFVTLTNDCSSCSGSSSEINAAVPEESDLVSKLQMSLIFRREEAMVNLRRMSREKDARVSLCTDQVLSELRSLIVSRFRTIQENAIASLVNLSLEEANRVKIVRAGILPNLVFVLMKGSSEAQEYAVAATFALALDDENKLAIGALGALPPLVDILRSSTSETAQREAATALYHLTLVPANCSKLVTTGSVHAILLLTRPGHLLDRLLHIVRNLGSCPDGRTALLDSGGTGCLLGLIDQNALNSVSVLERCLDALVSLSLVGLRFKGLAKAARATEILAKVKTEGPKRKAVYLVEKIEERSLDHETETEVDWEKLLEE